MVCCGINYRFEYVLKFDSHIKHTKPCLFKAFNVMEGESVFVCKNNFALVRISALYE